MRDVRMVGALVKVELADETESVIQVGFWREQHDALHIGPGERFFVTPKRFRVFTAG